MEHGVLVGRDAQVPELGGKLEKSLHLDTANVLEAAVCIAVAADAISDVADLAVDVTEVRHELLPLGGCLHCLAGIALTEAGDQQGRPVYDSGYVRCLEGLALVRENSGDVWLMRGIWLLTRVRCCH